MTETLGMKSENVKMGVSLIPNAILRSNRKSTRWIAFVKLKKPLGYTHKTHIKYTLVGLTLLHVLSPLIPADNTYY
jgi:hypothetical protein